MRAVTINCEFSLFGLSGFVLLSQLFQDADEKLSIFIGVGGVLEINARAIYSLQWRISALI